MRPAASPLTRRLHVVELDLVGGGGHGLADVDAVVAKHKVRQRPASGHAADETGEPATTHWREQGLTKGPQAPKHPASSVDF